MEFRVKLEPGDEFVREGGHVIVNYFGSQYISRRNYGIELSRPFVVLEVDQRDAQPHDWQTYRPNDVRPQPEPTESCS